MSHQPFETWITTTEDLTTTQTNLLEQHLQSCPQCRNIKSGWRLVERRLQSAAIIPAATGFATRFQANLENRKAKEHRRQVGFAAGFLGGLFVLVSLILMIKTVVVVTPARLIGEIIHFIALAPQRWLDIRFVIYYWGSQIPTVVLVIGIAIALGWTLLLVITWLLTYLRISHQGVKNQ
ncbi:MAG: hypothetical protein ROW48_15930 [Bellilinea sp.]